MRRVGPETASLRVHTYREGAAARVGHDLVLEVTRWEASVEDGRIELTADPASLEVIEGRGGVKPLTDGDRREIVKNIAKVLPREPITFRSTAVDGGAVEGELTVGGVARPISARLDENLRGSVALRHSDFGLRPYRGLMGALKVRDDVEVVIS